MNSIVIETYWHDFATFGFEDAAKKAKKAQDLYEDVRLDLWKSESDMQVVC
jgi:hypothetical protein